MTGRQVLGAVLCILLGTFVLPPMAAYAVNARRVARAERDVHAIAAGLAGLTARVAAGAVLEGPGRLPTAATEHAQAWLSGPHGSLPARLGGMDVPQDPWGNAYLVNRQLVVSAGPDGMIDTAFGAGSPAGDDVAAGFQR